MLLAQTFSRVSQRLKLWCLADNHLRHTTLSVSINITIIPLEKTFSSYDLPASDARVIQSGMKGVYLP